jgi:hypothetical protein
MENNNGNVFARNARRRTGGGGCLMPDFRTPRSLIGAPPAGGLSQGRAALRTVITDVLRPANFFVRTSASLTWEHRTSADEAWEIFQGCLLDGAQTRLRQSFETWNVYRDEPAGRAAEPFLSIKLDTAGERLHVVRALEVYAWEGYHAGGNVYLSRETRKWVRELVGSIPLARFENLDTFRDELIGLLFHAVVGTSRLPLTSLEAPLPDFSLGTLAYAYRARSPDGVEPAGPRRSFQDLLTHALSAELAWVEKAKLLEVVLRTVSRDEVPQAAELFLTGWQRLGHTEDELSGLFRTLFNEVALSPYTHFVDNFLAFLRVLVGRGRLALEAWADLLGYLLRQLCRHLTAYDLLTFHHRGANYPDALLLDAVLQEYQGILDGHPALFLAAAGDAAQLQNCKRLRRRAFRQAWLLRRHYEGLPVPDLPTSPGENARVLPPPFARVPEEQIQVPAKRTRRLFAETSLPAADGPLGVLLRQTVADLEHPAEVQELGLALFLDRPLGVFKARAEPDQTLLFSYEAFSATVAERRLQELCELGLLPARPHFEACRRHLTALAKSQGLALGPGQGTLRPGVVSLQDARQVADDFVLLRTTRRSVTDFLDQFDFAPLAGHIALDYLDPRQRVLIVGDAAGPGGPVGVLTIYDSAMRRRLELQVDPARGYERRAGREYPAAGLRVRRTWELGGAVVGWTPNDLQEENRMVQPRS